MAHQGAKLEDPDLRFELYEWIDKLEYWLLELPKPDKTILLHVPYKYFLELADDKDEKELEHQRITIKTYLELASLYNWNLIECVRNKELRTITDINDEILEIIVNQD